MCRWVCLPDPPLQDMRDQMKEMEVELLQYHKSNAALDLMIGELRLKRDGLQLDHDKVAGNLETASHRTKTMKQDVYDAGVRASTLKVSCLVVWLPGCP